ncbi:MAG: sigma-70 family RNA polymerase sigma factor [Oscillospiraceae bacterium]|nr:sigma-70 family RNA polymerase sigma factor [Oscillospiraceae bacterium]
MNDLEFSFEQSPWESFIRTKGMGDTVSAANLLTLLEGEDEQQVEDALNDLETGCMILDISDLPKAGGNGEAALRLRQEKALVKKGLNPCNLEENDPLRLYLEEIAGMPVCGDEALLARRCAEGSQSAMQTLTNLGLSRVVELAKEYVGYGVLLLDLIQEGSLGLWQAICNYHGGDYGTHRDRWIRFYMAKTVTLQARSSGVGQRMRQALEDYKEVDERLLSDLGRNATLAEIAEELHMSVEETASVKKMLDDARLMAQVKKPEEPEEEAEEEQQAVEDTALFRMRQRILDLLSGLDKQDQKLLTLRFGLEGGKPLSPEETGRRLGLTPEEVVVREGAALAKLRNQ